jgi:gas vesicle protein GvpL/GvpF
LTLLLYAITDRGDPWEAPCAGVEGQAVQVIVGNGLSALVSRHDTVPNLDPIAAWTYERVIEVAMADAAVLPARFGSLLADGGATEQMLRDRSVALTQTLDRIRGRAELSVRAMWTAAHGGSEPPPADAATGAAYMRARVEPERRARDVRRRISAALEPLAQATRYRRLLEPLTPVTAAFLVDRATIAEFVRRAEQLDRELVEADLICTGPWPAYSFVGEHACE